MRISKSGSSLKIDGNGGRIRTADYPGHIIADPTVCEYESTCDTELVIVGHEAGDEGCSMTLTTGDSREEIGGLDMEVSVKLVNRGDVLAYKDGNITLSHSRKRGNSGYWRARDTLLVIDDEVQGGATWRTEGESGGFQFNTECTNLSGPFYLALGTVFVNENVCTTGLGYYGGLYGGSAHEAVIKVAGGKQITFHGDCD